MHTAGLSLLAGFAALYAITVNGAILCNTTAPPTEMSANILYGLQKGLPNMVIDLCRTPPGEEGTISKQSDGLVFQLRRGDLVQDLMHCEAAFAAIISQCIQEKKVFGRFLDSGNGIEYHVLPGITVEYPNNAKYARAPAKNPKQSTSKPKPATGNPGNEKPENENPGNRKPASEKPANQNGRPVANPPPKKTPTRSTSMETPTQTKIKIGPTKNCKQIALFMQKQRKGSRVGRNIEEDRGGFSGSRVDISNRRELIKRVGGGDDDWFGPSEGDTIINHQGRAKKGTACGVDFSALKYPTADSMPSDALYYSIDSPKGDCEAIDFQATKTPILGEMKYHIEHILEWQTVAQFFDWMNRKMLTEEKTFLNPDPTRKGKQELNFCEYWKEHWKGSYPQEITINGKTLLPIDHITHAYPGLANNRENEFVWLQASINTPAKSNMWSYKQGNDASGTLHSEEKMWEHITGEKAKSKGKALEKVAAERVDKAKIALLKLKALMGARMYMRTKKISEIFKKQKEDIGTMLDLIDNELPNNPRTPTIGSKVLKAWEPQDLGKYWDEYMDERFAIAHKRTHNDMDTYLELLDDKWCEGRPKTPPATPKAGSKSASMDELTELMGKVDMTDPVKDLCRFLKKVQKAWDAEKKEPWTAPWKN